ncbi:MAG: DUF86 domain-containing protein [Sedimentisphaerales bacterium]|nr:DUF86 domain-containing protein [Sedimentisphaerales bacterium]
MPEFSISHEDRVRLSHMLDGALEIRQYVDTSTREDLDNDRKLVHSLVRLLEIIGEAASQVSDELRESFPEIPWMVIVGMRNRLIHAYFAINLEVIWSTSKEDIPLLIAELKRILGRA